MSGDFLKWLWRYPVLAIGTVVALALGIAGAVSEALDLYTGLPAWAWQMVAMVIFVAVVLQTMYTWDRDRLAVAATQPPGAKARTILDPKAAALHEIEKAMANSATVAFSNSQGGAVRVIPQLKSAILSLHKQFGIPDVESNCGNALADLEWLRRYADQVRHHLRAGHIDEAREAAKQYIGGRDA